jgi:uncharacterized protein YbjQ (UPF0145 family)
MAQPESTPSRIMATTTLAFEGYRIVEYRGIVRGVVVRSPTIAQGVMGGLRSIVGGQIKEYTQMCEQTRQQATNEMMRHAQEVGANAVIGIGYDASEIGDKATEVLCYGTAVSIEKVDSPATSATTP